MRTIAARLLMAFLCVIVFLVLQAVSAHIVTTRISRVQMDALSRELRIESLQERLAGTRLAVFKILGTMDPHEMDRLRGGFEEAVQPLSGELAAQGISPDLIRKNNDLYRRVIALHYDFSVRTARTLINEDSKEIHEEIVRMLEKRGRELARATSLRVREAHRKGNWISAGLLVCALAAAGIWAFVLMHTLTDRRRADAQLRESEERYRRLVEHSFDGIAIHRNGRIVFINTAGARLLGASRPEEILGKLLLDFVHPDYRDVVIGRVQEARSQGRAASLIEEKLVRLDGKELDAEVAGIAVAYEGRPAVQVVFRDITARKEAERALRESESRFRILFDLSPQAIALTEVASGRLLDVNARFLEITGYEKNAVTGRSTADLFYSPEDRRRFLDEIEASGAVRGLEMAYRARDGSMIQALVFSRKIQLAQGPVLLTIFLDITQQKRLEAQLQQAQRLESIGTLAGGIAHDFNNLLMGIQGRTSLMLTDLNDSHPHRGHLKSIEEHVRSASDLTRQILGFARGGRYEVKPTDLNDLVSRSAKMFGRTRKDIRITMDLRENIPAVEADRRQIEQVMFNLLVNASHAMPDGGEIRIGTEAVSLDEEEAPLHQAEPGRYAVIRVADTGVGMNRATLQRIFDPFFTTKELGRGTGLGLASAYGIIKNHGGFIEVTSSPGLGTTFTIHLPATDLPATESREAERDLSLGSGTILLVDDEQLVADVGAKMIEKLGYEPLVARSGQEALDIYERERSRIDLVLLDMVMPGMGGGETFDRLHEVNPDVRVILSSGYSMDGRATEILKRGCKGFIQKPFDLHELSEKLRETLAAG
ncbi:MAG: PAS domain S-box protein [Deltaproteobacteria bacterium]|nr:PAS domain S-box protein [Deltaproteobacteria bacterium]